MCVHVYFTTSNFVASSIFILKKKLKFFVFFLECVSLCKKKNPLVLLLLNICKLSYCIDYKHLDLNRKFSQRRITSTGLSLARDFKGHFTLWPKVERPSLSTIQIVRTQESGLLTLCTRGQSPKAIALQNAYMAILFDQEDELSIKV